MKDHHGGGVATTATVIRPGETCWRVARADRMAVIIDADAYFRHLKSAILKARKSILLIGWDFDTRVELDRSGEGDNAVPNEVGALLKHVVRVNRGLRVNILRWDLAFLKMPLRGTTLLFLLDWFGSKRLNIRLDSRHPPGACHHQKIVVIDDRIAFCGGIDVTIQRWDTPAHVDDDPRRVRPDGTRETPWHDVTTAVEGPAARALGDLARARWLAATGQALPVPDSGDSCWPEALDPDFTGVDVGIARTCPEYDDDAAVREIEALYLAAIASARRTIYLESQYFSAQKISAAIGARLGEADGPEVVIVNPREADGWLEEKVMGSARAILIQQLRAGDIHDRLRFYTPVTRAGTDIYVHAKVLVIDDALLRVGSSNINNRSMGVDTECDLVIEADGDADARSAIVKVRDELIAEHLGIALDAWYQTLAEEDGSIVRAIDRRIRLTGKTLVPFAPPELNDIEQTIGETHFLDPDGSEAMSPVFVKAMRSLPSKRTVATGAAMAALGFAAWQVSRGGRGRRA